MEPHDEDTEKRLNEQRLETLRGDLRAFHDYLEEQAVQRVNRVAYSTDGRVFSYEAPLSLPIPVGCYVQLRVADDQQYLGQITTKDVVKRDGAELGYEFTERQRDLVPDGVNISDVRDRIRVPMLEGTGVLLGRVTADAVTATTDTDVYQNATSEQADTTVEDRYLSRSGRNATLPIGHALFVDGQAAVHLDAGGFNRHTFLCGQSGSGKTFSLGIVLEQLLLETDLRIVIIDPNSDFINLGTARPRDEVNRFRRDPLSEEAYDELVREYRAATAGLQVFRPQAVATDTDEVLRVRFGDLSRDEQASVLELDPLDDREEFNTFRHFVDSLGDREYSWEELRETIVHDFSSEARNLGLRIENLDLADWDVWCSPGEPSLVDTLNQPDWRCLVLDIGTLGSSSEQMVVANAVFTHLWSERNRRQPTLVVIDEAHNICPAKPADELVAMSTASVDRIAAEGRKFGLYLLLSTQRPGKIPDNVLSQCHNLILMRVNSSADIAHLSTGFSQVPASLLNEVSKFGLGETILSGRIVQNPTFAKFEGRISVEGGSDVPSTWATPRE